MVGQKWVVPSGLGLGGLCLVVDGGGMDTAEKHDPLAILRCWGGVGGGVAVDDMRPRHVNSYIRTTAFVCRTRHRQ